MKKSHLFAAGATLLEEKEKRRVPASTFEASIGYGWRATDGING